MNILTPIQLATQVKQIGSLQPGTGKGFATLELKSAGQDIYVEVDGPLVPELKQSQFNPNKLQLVQDISANGPLLAAFTQLRREIEAVLETECNPDYLLEVKPIESKGKIYITWPKDRQGYAAVFVGEKSFRPQDENFQEFVDMLKQEGLKTVIRLYAWVRYISEPDAHKVQKIQIGVTPQLFAISHK